MPDSHETDLIAPGCWRKTLSIPVNNGPMVSINRQKERVGTEKADKKSKLPNTVAY